MNSSARNDQDHSHRRTVTLEAGPNQRLELELANDAQGNRELTLRELNWGNGVGWFVQKSIRLESAQVDGLLRALCCLRQAPAGSERGAALELRCPLADLAANNVCHPGEVLTPEFRRA